MYRILLTFTILPVLVCTINTSYANSNDSTNTVFTPLYSLNQVKSFIKPYDPKLPIDEYDTAYTKDNLFHINLLAIGPENFLGLDFNYESKFRN